MGIRSFFHKIKLHFVRARESSIPYVDGVKRYGNYGEDEFAYTLYRALPTCKIKRNVIVSTAEGNAEIDCLVLYQNKLFAIEVKKWKGDIFEVADGFVQVKTDRWTGEKYQKVLKSPFKQLGRAVYLLRKQIPTRAWVNTIVFFGDDEIGAISTSSDHIWFTQYHDLLAYICAEGRESAKRDAIDFFEACVPADYLYANGWDKSLRCLIDRADLCFESAQGTITADQIACIHVSHRWSYDELCITLKNGQRAVVKLENAHIRVSENGRIGSYAFCKLDYVGLGGTLTQ